LPLTDPLTSAQAHFPLSDLLKTEVRDIARRYLLPAAEKEESMGLCFVGERPRPADAAAAVRQPLPRNVPPAVSGGAFGAFLGESCKKPTWSLH
jgi:tRNA-specific 2-thiouridylase